MLGKLIKHEFKATSRVYFPLFIAYCIVIIMLKLFENFLSSFDAPIMMILFGALAAIFGILSSILYIFPIISSIVRFRKNVLGDEGYLTNTLPINSHHIILSKIVISLIWCVISGFSLLITQIISSAGDIKFDSFIDFIKYMIGLPQYYYDNPLLIVLLLFCVIVFISAFILMFYSSICIGQLWNSQRWLKSIISFIALGFGVLIVLGLILPGFDEPLQKISWDETKVTYYIMWIFLSFNLLFGGIFYFITYRVLSKRLNIQ